MLEVKRMRLLMYRPEDYQPGSRLQKNLELIVPPEQMEVFHSMSDLKHGLRQPGEHTEIGVFVCSDPAELEQLHKMRALLLKLSLILVFPEHDPEVINQAYKLKPRYITYVDSAEPQLLGVVARLTDV
jgi:hypothetical protein